MQNYLEMAEDQLKEEAADLERQYENLKAKGLKLDLSRGKPDGEQLRLSYGLLDAVTAKDSLLAQGGMDCGNYGGLEGIPEARRLMADMMDMEPEQVLVGGNSSLNLMHDCLGIAWLHGMPGGSGPWSAWPEAKFLCPSPGYDRHFAVSEHFGLKLIAVPMKDTGPDMDIVEELTTKDSSIKGIWCVPKYSNPTGITYSDETVERLANLNPAAKDFLIFWDNAYAVHHLSPDQPDQLLSLARELKKSGKENMALQFTSTSKVTFPGGGIAAVGASEENLKHLIKHMSLQTIGFDKINQLRHTRFFEGIEGVERHMRLHAELLRPKFEAVKKTLAVELKGLGIARWTDPRGGYFVSLDVMEGCAKRTLVLCKEAGVTMTGAGATFPYGEDPKDSNIRIAPTFAKLEEVWQAAALLCLCVKRACVEKLLAEKRLCSRAS